MKAEIEIDKQEHIEIMAHLPEIIKRMESEIKALRDQIDGLNIHVSELAGLI
jgi:SMC interacting uncharacterized protein involved in chromosome segregation